MNKNKKGKIIFWLILIVFAFIIVIQNQEFFFEPEHLDVDLYFTQFTIPKTPVVAMFVIVFVLGWLIACIPAIIVRYRLQKVNKVLNLQLEDKKSDLASLKKHVDSLKKKEPLSEISSKEKQPEAPAESLEPDEKGVGSEVIKEAAASVSEKSGA